jgi:hypothetical protein
MVSPLSTIRILEIYFEFFLSVNDSGLMLCRRPAGALIYILLFIIPTLTRGATICHPLRGLNNKDNFALYYSLRRRCNNVAQRRKPWENEDYIKTGKPPQGGGTLVGGIRGTCTPESGQRTWRNMRIVDRVETTGYITLSLRDREKVNARITEITELKILSPGDSRLNPH